MEIARLKIKAVEFKLKGIQIKMKIGQCCLKSAPLKWEVAHILILHIENGFLERFPLRLIWDPFEGTCHSGLTDTVVVSSCKRKKPHPTIGWDLLPPTASLADVANTVLMRCTFWRTYLKPKGVGCRDVRSKRMTLNASHQLLQLSPGNRSSHCHAPMA